jgi:hypothetical protein
MVTSMPTGFSLAACGFVRADSPADWGTLLAVPRTTYRGGEGISYAGGRRAEGCYPGTGSTGSKTAVKWRNAAGSDTIR